MHRLGHFAFALGQCSTNKIAANSVYKITCALNLLGGASRCCANGVRIIRVFISVTMNTFVRRKIDHCEMIGSIPLFGGMAGRPEEEAVEISGALHPTTELGKSRRTQLTKEKKLRHMSRQ